MGGGGVCTSPHKLSKGDGGCFEAFAVFDCPSKAAVAVIAQQTNITGQLLLRNGKLNSEADKQSRE